MTSFPAFVRNQYTDLPVPQPPADIANATYIVTGANTGLGFECTKHLFRMGAGRIIVAVRSLEKGETALAAIREATGRKDAGEVWQLDLASLDSVEAFGERVGKLDRLDCLIANAGVVMTEFQEIEGTETSLLVNGVSTMLLAFRTLPKLKESARRFGVKTHFVTVSSNTALESDRKRTMANVQGDVFDALSEKKGFKTLAQYPTTKLIGLLATRQLALLVPTSESGVIIDIVNPGLCYSELDRNGAPILRLGLAVMRKVLARTTEVGSRTLLHAAFTGPEAHGKYCSECKIRDDVVPDWITNENGQRMQKRVWDDLLKRLAARGHPVDIAALAAK